MIHYNMFVPVDTIVDRNQQFRQFISLSPLRDELKREELNERRCT